MCDQCAMCPAAVWHLSLALYYLALGVIRALVLNDVRLIPLVKGIHD